LNLPVNEGSSHVAGVSQAPLYVGIAIDGTFFLVKRPSVDRIINSCGRQDFPIKNVKNIQFLY
jgi:hypothetical protein